MSNIELSNVEIGNIEMSNVEMSNILRLYKHCEVKKIQGYFLGKGGNHVETV
ncbi:MAG: hypothetical protein GY757_49200 [bacterium]|nr:hypothetical protein [bacterium]